MVRPAVNTKQQHQRQHQLTVLKLCFLGTRAIKDCDSEDRFTATAPVIVAIPAENKFHHQVGRICSAARGRMVGNETGMMQDVL